MPGANRYRATIAFALATHFAFHFTLTFLFLSWLGSSVRQPATAPLFASLVLGSAAYAFDLLPACVLRRCRFATASRGLALAFALFLLAVSFYPASNAAAWPLLIVALVPLSASHFLGIGVLTANTKMASEAIHVHSLFGLCGVVCGAILGAGLAQDSGLAIRAGPLAAAVVALLAAWVQAGGQVFAEAPFAPEEVGTASRRDARLIALAIAFWETLFWTALAVQVGLSARTGSPLGGLALATTSPLLVVGEILSHRGVARFALPIAGLWSFGTSAIALWMGWPPLEFFPPLILLTALFVWRVPVLDRLNAGYQGAGAGEAKLIALGSIGAVVVPFELAVLVEFPLG